jgi:hypothetical protein
MELLQQLMATGMSQQEALQAIQQAATTPGLTVDMIVERMQGYAGNPADAGVYQPTPQTPQMPQQGQPSTGLFNTPY